MRILALGRNVKAAPDFPLEADLPLGIDVTLASDQPVVVKNAYSGIFMESLWQAIAIVMACSIVSLGVPGAVVALSIPLHGRDHLPDHGIHRYRFRSGFRLGALIIGAGPAGGRRHDPRS